MMYNVLRRMTCTRLLSMLAVVSLYTPGSSAASLEAGSGALIDAAVVTSTSDVHTQGTPQRGLLNVGRCGGVGAPPCPVTGCFPGLEVAGTDGLCLPVLDENYPCSLEGQDCCFGAGAVTGTCSRFLQCGPGNKCRPCGGLNELACDSLEGRPCSGGLVEFSGICVSDAAGVCGSKGQACCAGDVCKKGYTCTGSTCERCGASKQPFCATFSGCKGGLRVVDGVCGKEPRQPPPSQPDCGKVGELVCTSGLGCELGLEAYNGICLPELRGDICGVPFEECCAGVTCVRGFTCNAGICSP